MDQDATVLGHHLFADKLYEKSSCRWSLFPWPIAAQRCRETPFPVWRLIQTRSIELNRPTHNEAGSPGYAGLFGLVICLALEWGQLSLHPHPLFRKLLNREGERERSYEFSDLYSIPIGSRYPSRASCHSGDQLTSRNHRKMDGPA